MNIRLEIYRKGLIFRLTSLIGYGDLWVNKADLL